MKKLRDYPPVLLNVLALHEAFRRLSFEADELFIEPNRDETGAVALFVVVKAQGREFRAIAGHVGDMTIEQMYDLWVELATQFNAGLFDEADEDAVCYEFWRAHGGERGLVEALVRKGFVRADFDPDDLADRIVSAGLRGSGSGALN